MNVPVARDHVACGGRGSLRVGHVAGKSVVTRARAESPLRLVVANRERAPWIFVTSFGGGLVGRDALSMDVELGDGANALLTTQSSTKIYRPAHADHPGSTSETRARVGEGAFLALLPDAVVPYADARYSQRTTVELAEGASLAFVDAIAAGRVARDERWDFARVRSEVAISRAGKNVLRDALLLDRAHGSLRTRMSRFDVIATIVLAGPALATARTRILAELEALPPPNALRDGPARVLAATDVVESGSALASGDILVVRLAATTMERAVEHIRRYLVETCEVVGDVHARKR